MCLASGWWWTRGQLKSDSLLQGLLVFWGIGVSASIAGGDGWLGWVQVLSCSLEMWGRSRSGALVPRNAHSGWFLVVPPHGVGWPTSGCPVWVD